MLNEASATFIISKPPTFDAVLVKGVVAGIKKLSADACCDDKVGSSVADVATSVNALTVTFANCPAF